MNNYQLSIKNYQFYKDSGVEWLGDVPEHWEERRVKDIATLERGKFTHRPRNDPQMYDGVHPFIQTGDVARAIKYITVYKQTLSDKGTTVSKKFKKGTLVMAIAANIGDVAIVDFATYFPDSIVAYKPKNNDTDYLFYLFSATRHELDKVKVTSTQDNLNLERLNSLIRFIPPLSEQKSIAHYLDTKTAQCDRKIDLLTQKATQYGKLKQSLINETVTRGLDKSVPMKDSAIGEILEHWEVKRIKEVADINKRTLTDKTPDNYEFDYIDIGSVTYGVHGFSSERMTFDNSPSRARRIVKQGDTIISTVRTYLKAIASIDNNVSDLIVSTGFAVVSPKKSIFSKYFSYWLTANYTIDEICALSTGVSYPATNASAISNLFCLVPPLSEQNAIADYLDTKTAQIDQIIQTINTQIEKLKELRKTLINDVVTGKIKAIDN